MKKNIFTLSIIFLFALAGNAQDDKKNSESNKTIKKEVVNIDGTLSVIEEPVNNNQPVKKQNPKSSSSKMAINKKGNTGVKKEASTNNSINKPVEEKSGLEVKSN